MFLLWLLAALAQCGLLYVLWRGGDRLGRSTATLPHSHPKPLIDPVPVVALFIPAGGCHPAMPDAVRSLLHQDYPRVIPVIITAKGHEPAALLARELRATFPQLRHVVAGQASHCGQKNHNILRGIAAVKDEADIYVFCDSTHKAPPDLVRQLVQPIASGEAAFSTGYHQVLAEDEKPVTLAYQICVLLMRLLQAVSVFTQPWGGAMAMSRRAFEHHRVGELWKDNIVDDCSLAGFLLREGLHVRLCPAALLDTTARHHPLDIWRAWMERQVLFLKFCVPVQWWLLGVLCVIMTVPPVLSALFVLAGMLGMLPPTAAWLTLGGLTHWIVLIWVMLGWRHLQPGTPPFRLVNARAWLTAFALACGMFATVYVTTFRRWTLSWHGIRYHVGKGGRVMDIEQPRVGV